MSDDGLSIEHKAAAWDHTYHPSFNGRAIVGSDSVIKFVNPQFCSILNVTPAELVGKRFQDITPQIYRRIDEINAQMVMRRESESYLMEKYYEFIGKKSPMVELLVNGVYSREGEFLFFVARIMLIPEEGSPLPAPPQMLTLLSDSIKENYKVYLTIGTIIGGAIWAIVKGYFKL